MRVLLDVNENKSLFLMELLNNFSFVKAKPITDETDFLLSTEKETDTATEIKILTHKKIKKDPFAEVFGMWADRDIDATTLRKQAWGIEN